MADAAQAGSVQETTGTVAFPPCPWCSERRQTMQPFGGIKLTDGRELTGWAIVCGAGHFCPIVLFGFKPQAEALALYGRRLISGEATVHWNNLTAKQGDSDVADERR